MPRSKRWAIRLVLDFWYFFVELSVGAEVPMHVGRMDRLQARNKVYGWWW